MRKQISEHFDNYIYLNKNERNGLIALLIIAAGFLILPYCYEAFRKKEPTDFSGFIKEIESHQKNPTTHNMSSQTEPSAALTVNLDAVLFYFDPNSASKEDFLKLGLNERTTKTIVNYRQAGGYFYQPKDMKKLYTLSDEDFERIKNHIRIEGNKKKKQKDWPSKKPKKKTPKSYVKTQLNHSMFDPNTAPEKILLENGIPKKQAGMIIKYRNKGGKFYQKEDLKKIYGMPESVYKNLESYIDIKNKFPKKEKPIIKASAEKPVANLQIDINKSSPEEWQKLRGIGPAFSKRITKFRDGLGGFYSIEQVGETYGLPDSTFQSIKTQLVKSPIFGKININKSSEEGLKKHPYISWKQAKLIVSYRTMHGEFKLVEDVLQVQALNQEWFDKVKYYLTK